MFNSRRENKCFSQRIYISDRTHSTPQRLPNICPPNLSPALSDSQVQRVCTVHTYRGEMGGGRLFLHVKLNLIDPCRTVRANTTVEGCQAGRLGHQFQYMRECNAESPKQGRKRFNSLVKTINIADLAYGQVVGVVYSMYTTNRAGRGWVRHMFGRCRGMLCVLTLIYVYSLH